MMLVLLLVCVGSFLVLCWLIRSAGVSLGLPIAFLYGTLFNYLPGALAHALGGSFFADSSATEIGLRLTTIGTVCFVVGAALAQRFMKKPLGKSDSLWLQQGRTKRFAIYCYIGGFLVMCSEFVFARIPSLGAAIQQGSTIWILGVIIGVLGSVQQKRYGHTFLWLVALSVYPLMVLIGAGFLSFGSTPVFMVMSALLLRLKSHVRAYSAVTLASFVFFLSFLSYFENRDNIREATWGGGALDQRAARCLRIITDLRWFDSSDPKQLTALDVRLNQCEFVGMAAKNIASGQVDYLYGRSILEGLQSLVPRAIWSDKPVFEGSSKLIRETTGFVIKEGVSFGAGQVLEFYVNFGMPGLVMGFLLLGFMFRWIDRKAAAALQGGEFDRVFVWFLVGTALNEPLGNIAAAMENVAAALVAAFGWRHAWGAFGAKTPAKRPQRKPRFIRQRSSLRPPDLSSHDIETSKTAIEVGLSRSWTGNRRGTRRRGRFFRNPLQAQKYDHKSRVLATSGDPNESTSLRRHP